MAAQQRLLGAIGTTSSGKPLPAIATPPLAPLDRRVADSDRRQWRSMCACAEGIVLCLQSRTR
eukprot:9142851-Alexandrium_andersonii.AAC.1